MSVADPYGYNYVQSPHTDIVTINGTTGWTKTTGGTGELFVADTTNVKRSSSALSLTTPTAGTDNVTLKQEGISPIAVTADTWIGVMVYLPVVNEGLSGSPSCQIYFSDASSGFTRTWRMKRLLESGAMRSGWNFICGRLGDTDHFQLSGTPPVYSSGIQGVQIVLDHNDPTNTTPIKWVFDSIVVMGTQRPKLMLTWDDGDAEQFSVVRGYMNTNKIPSNYYINSSTIGNSGVMTLANIQTLYSENADIVNHGDVHTNYTSFTQAQAKSNYDTCRDYLINNAMPRGANHFAYPFGTRNLETDGWIEGFGALTARTTEILWKPHIPAETTIMLDTFNLGSTVLLATAKTYIDDLVLLGATGTILGHVIDTGNSAADTRTWNESDFTLLIDHIMTYVDAGTLDVVTVSQWYNGLSSTRNDAIWKARL